jgi:hypothetical protein
MENGRRPATLVTWSGGDPSDYVRQNYRGMATDRSPPPSSSHSDSCYKPVILINTISFLNLSKLRDGAFEFLSANQLYKYTKYSTYIMARLNKFVLWARDRPCVTDKIST